MDYQLLAAVFIGIGVLLFLILKLKIQAFLALLIASICVGLIGGMPAMDVIESMKSGMGGTLGFVATIVGLGALFGAILEYSGGAQAIAKSMIDKFGTDRAPLAMTITGFVIAIPVFFDVAFIILIPVIYALQKKTGKSLLAYGIPLLAGLAVTHAFIPPTPGPVAVADIIGANLGWVILMGIIVGIPTTLVAGLWFGKYISSKIMIEAPDFKEDASAVTNPPPASLILWIIALPIFLVLLDTVSGIIGDGYLGAQTLEFISFIGHPFTALILANLLAWYVLGIRRGHAKEVLSEVSLKSLGPAGMIILLTGAGGVLKQILVDTGVGLMLAESMSGFSTLPVIYAFIVAVLVRVMQGSATVAMITAAGLTAPILDPVLMGPAQLALIVIAIAAGASSLSHVNDSGFWLVNRYLGLTEKQTFRSWTVMTTLIGLCGFVIAFLLSLVL